jgi:hypothetical protein
MINRNRAIVDSYVALVEQARREMFGPQRQAWMARLEQEHDELRALLHWLATQGFAEQGLRLAGAAETLRESIKVLIPPFSARLDWEKRSLDLAWHALDKETGAALWAEGQVMTLAQAVAYALE